MRNDPRIKCLSLYDIGFLENALMNLPEKAA